MSLISKTDRTYDERSSRDGRLWLLCDHIGPGMFRNERTARVVHASGVVTSHFVEADSTRGQYLEVRTNAYSRGTSSSPGGVWVTLPTAEMVVVLVDKARLWRDTAPMTRGTGKAVNPLEENMKATLTFDLPEEGDELYTAQRGQDYLFVLQDMDRYLRNRLKYGDLSEEQAACLEAARHQLHVYLDDRGIDLQE